MTEGMLLLLFPAIGYWFAFLYEYGFCLYFDVPPTFISIAPAQILFTALIVVIAVFYFVGVIDTIISASLSSAGTGMKFNIIRDLVIILGTLSLISILKANSLSAIVGLFFIWFFMSGIDFIYPLLNTKDGLSYMEKYEVQFEKDRDYSSKQETVTGNLLQNLV